MACQCGVCYSEGMPGCEIVKLRAVVEAARVFVDANLRGTSGEENASRHDLMVVLDKLEGG